MFTPSYLSSMAKFLPVNLISKSCESLSTLNYMLLYWNRLVKVLHLRLYSVKSSFVPHLNGMGCAPTTPSAPAVPGVVSLVFIGFTCIMAKIFDKMAHFLASPPLMLFVCSRKLIALIFQGFYHLQNHIFTSIVYFHFVTFSFCINLCFCIFFIFFLKNY